MKQRINNEIDLLLRRQSRRESGLLPGSDRAPSSEGHLDTDELNSYAENALPVGVRARYTEHLAECAKCRTIVTQLSLAAGAVLAEKPGAAAGPSRLRQLLSSLFAPQVLRYAVPALALVCVVGIGLIVFRRQTANEFVARNIQSSPAASVEQQQVPGVGELNDSVKQDESRTSQKVVEVPEVQKSGAKMETESSQTAKSPAAEAPPAPANQPAGPDIASASPPAKYAVDDNKGQRSADFEKKNEVKVADEVSARQVAKETAREEDRKAEAASVAKSAPGVAQSQPTATGRAQLHVQSRDNLGRSRQEKADKDDAEVRSVAGRRFRREGGVWIDTAYDSSRSTMNLARGSEQYRALVADEPPIRTIAEQLDGEIIVVWKSRAYRIR